MDPFLLGQGVEVTSQLFLQAMELYTRRGARVITDLAGLAAGGPVISTPLITFHSCLSMRNYIIGGV